MSALIKECLYALKTSATAGDDQTLDIAKAREVFQALHVEGESLRFTTVKLLAIETGWPHAQATQLALLAREVSAGPRAATWDFGNWGVPLVAVIKAGLARRP